MSPLKTMLLVILVAALGGGIPPFTKLALATTPTALFVSLRFLTAALILIPLLMFTQKLKLPKITPKLIALSLLGTGNVFFFALGIKFTTATSSQILYAAVPIIALIASWLILKNTFPRQKILGVVLGFIGVLGIIFSPKFGQAATQTSSITGNLLILTAVVSYSLYTIFSKRAQKTYSPLMITTIMVCTTLVVQSLFIPFELGHSPSSLNLTPVSLIAIFYTGIIGTAIYFLLYQKVIKVASPLIASTTFYLQPIFTFIWSHFLLHEQLSLSVILWGLLAFLGAGLVMR